MTKVRNVIVVLQKGFEDELYLWGVFEEFKKAITSIQDHDMHKSKAKFLPILDHPELAAGIVDEEQDWEAVVDASIEDPDAGDVWGYMITDRLQ